MRYYDIIRDANVRYRAEILAAALWASVSAARFNTRRELALQKLRSEALQAEHEAASSDTGVLRRAVLQRVVAQRRAAIEAYGPPQRQVMPVPHWVPQLTSGAAYLHWATMLSMDAVERGVIVQPPALNPTGRKYTAAYDYYGVDDRFERLWHIFQDATDRRGTTGAVEDASYTMFGEHNVHSATLRAAHHPRSAPYS